MRKIVIGAFADLPASILGADGRPASTASSGKPLTGEPDAGDLQVRFGGRGGANQCPVPTSITCAAAHRHSELSVRPLFRQRSEQVKFPNCRLWAEAQCLKQMLPCEQQPPGGRIELESNLACMRGAVFSTFVAARGV